MEEERQRLSSQGREAVIWLYAIDEALKHYDAYITPTSRRLKNGYRDYRLIRATLDRLLTSLLDTIPIDQLMTIKRHLSSSEVRVRTVSAGSSFDGCNWVISQEDLLCLVSMAVENTCFVCDGHKNGCQLRKILDNVPAACMDNPAIACKEG